MARRLTTVLHRTQIAVNNFFSAPCKLFRLTAIASYAIHMAMTLTEYLAQEGKTASALAKACGCAVSSITRAASGDITPSRELMQSIHRETGGAVTPNDFYGVEA